MPSKVAEWNVPLISSVKKIELFYGSFLGGRTITVDGDEMIQRSFSLETVETFSIESTKFQIKIDKSSSPLKFLIEIDGQDFETYTTNFNRKYEIWIVRDGLINWRIVLDKSSMAIYVNGEEKEKHGSEFTEDFTRVGRFTLTKRRKPCYICTKSSDDIGITFILNVDGIIIPNQQIDSN